jgi:hypothetical protein
MKKPTDGQAKATKEKTVGDLKIVARSITALLRTMVVAYDPRSCASSRATGWWPSSRASWGQTRDQGGGSTMMRGSRHAARAEGFLQEGHDRGGPRVAIESRLERR